MASLRELLGAINLASYEPNETLTISLEDLMFLRSVILELQQNVKQLESQLIFERRNTSQVGLNYYKVLYRSKNGN